MRRAGAHQLCSSDRALRGDVETVPQVDARDVGDQRAELRLVEVLGGRVRDRVRHLIRPVGEARQGLVQGPSPARSASRARG
jgi:hypothetical protein